MTEPLTAGEPLAPQPGRRREAPQAKPPAPPKRPRRFSWLGRLFGTLLGLMLVAGAGGGIVLYAAYKKFSADLPDIDGLQHYQPRVMSRLYAGDSRLLAELATERRIFVPSSAIPDIVKRAFISAEDQNFFIHRGVDPIAIVRAAVTDLQQYGQGRRPVGASTITQQVAKNMLLGNEVSLARKAREAILAIRIDESLSKDRVLELYLNEIYLGLQSYGVAAAAQAYFNKSLDQLTLPEAAFLAALPKAPNNYNPFRFPDAAKGRRDWVIDRMAEDRAITAEQAAAAKATPITPSPFRRPETVAGGDYFAEEVRRQMVDRFGADQTTQGGLVVQTTLDPVLQAAADKALHDGLIRYDQRRGGWRGAVAHVDGGATLRQTWANALAQQARPAGMLPEWRLAIVTETTDAEAKLGFVERPSGAAAGQPRVLPMLLSDLGWARPVRDGKPGAAPRRISDVVQVGDIVMAELVAATPAVPGRAPARPERLLLRQIPQVQGALVSLDPATGRVLAMSGGWSFELSQFNRATQANRQPGSSFKPYVYLTALEHGVSPSQRFLDAPFVVDQGAAGKWRPGNYELDFNGPMPLRVALEKSRNLVTIRVADRIGMEAVAQTAIGFHVVDNMPRVLPAALGAVETTVLRQAAGYAGFAAGGKEVTPTLIDSVQDRDGKVIWRASGPGTPLDCTGCNDPAQPPQLTDTRKQVVDPDSTFQLVTMMQGVVQRGTGVAAGAGLNRAIAGKTGTSQDFNDSWFVGFTPDLVTAVWVGFDTPTSLGNNETGSSNGAPIWHDFMAVALKTRPNLKFIPPPGVTMASWDTGWGTVTDAFKPDQTPGASGPIGSGGGGAAGPAAASDGAPPEAAGVDSGLGGLY
ncbi:penicillin-binding protein 1A [Limobrevibacterium gyesilva]|uniref:Penicillin-binding protein 1A n=1 Tax=Limobrevibacterium gyesilva TaxID=2991712 RepID=A0AA41YR12_9PROT|nr:PBP1A family penicillin-binding protein [Limobrevibacterium gyesilva]MCW3476713.1 PBP1A family penicillin-binding protein [Limobrevibacterium gyesilva]